MILTNPTVGWSAVFDQLTAGAHVVVRTFQHADVLEARRAGFEFRDTFAILMPGPRVQFGLLLRKPLSEATVVEQLLATGTGALHISACRIAAQSDADRATYEANCSGDRGHSENRKRGLDFEMGCGSANPTGRWPTNLILVHSPDCVRVGDRKVPGHKGYPNGPGGKSYQYTSEKRSSEVRPDAWAGHADADGMETVAAYACAEGCPVPALDGQSGERKATLTGRADPRGAHANPGDNGGASWFGGGNSQVYADSGGASRFYVQVEGEDGLEDWFGRLLS